MSRHKKYRCKSNPNRVQESDDLWNQNISAIEDTAMFNKLVKAVVKEIQGSMDVNIQNIQNQNIQNIQNQTNNNVTIYVNEKVDFLEILTAKFGGDEQKAISYLKEKISRSIEGDIELFCDIYFVGRKKENWPLIMADKKNKVFLIKNRESGGFITDAGGRLIHRNFKKII